MASKEDKQDQDDLSFLRTEDFICLNCSVTMQNGITRRLALSAEAFGNKMCFLEDISVEVSKQLVFIQFNSAFLF
jgi:ryanodine receptor 2